MRISFTFARAACCPSDDVHWLPYCARPGRVVEELGSSPNVPSIIQPTPFLLLDSRVVRPEVIGALDVGCPAEVKQVKCPTCGKSRAADFVAVAALDTMDIRCPSGELGQVCGLAGRLLFLTPMVSMVEAIRQVFQSKQGMSGSN